MRFRGAHKLTSYLMVAAALGTLASSGSVSLFQLIAFGIAATLSWFAEIDASAMRWLGKLDLPLKISVLGFFSLTVFSLVKAFPEPDLTSLLDLVLVLLAYKLLQRRSNRDYLQIYILSFLLILAASWLAQSALFAVGFGIYVVALTWSLILFHLRREIEDNYLVKHEATSAAQRVTAARVLDSRRVVGPAFFWATALAALGVMVGATIVFALAPRIGIGFLTGGMRRRSAVVGFSDQVRLGHHGALSTDNQTVVLRVGLSRLTEDMLPEQRDRVIQSLYWRGTVYDTYNSGQWLRSRAPITKTLIATVEGDNGSRWSWISGPEAPQLRPSRKESLQGAERQEIQLVGLSHPVAFALDRPVAFEILQPATGSFVSTLVEGQYSGESSLKTVRASPSGRMIPMADFAGARYVAYSQDSMRLVRPGQAKPLDELPAELLSAHLQVPEALRTRLLGLAQRITAQATTPAARAQAVVQWLNRNKSYSLELKRDERYSDPLEDFLLAQSGGHCEYFATSAAILMRLVGVPTRYVNGFLGGEWNNLTNHVTVRDNRAHSWIEAYFSDFGWTRLDATPALSRSARMGRIRQLLDSIEAWWGQWVIEYDASRQIKLARGLAKSLGFEKRRQAAFVWPRPDRNVVLGALGVGLGVYLLLRARRRRKGSRDKGASPAAARGMAHRVYDKALRALAPHGWLREPAETPREFLCRVRRSHPEAAAPFALITSAYEQVRFAERPLTLEQMQSMQNSLAELERVCHQKPLKHAA